MPTQITGDVMTINRRIRTPGALDWSDGTAIDAGTATILSSNLNHLQAESLRHLVATLGPGYLDLKDPYDGIIDRSPTGNDLDVIPWGPTSAKVFGPFDILAEPKPVDGRAYLRTVRVDVAVNGGADSSLKILTALTPIDQTPGREEGSTLCWQMHTCVAGSSIARLNLSTAGPYSPSRSRIGRFDSGRGATQSRVTDICLWVGWLATNADDAVLTINAYEVR